MTVDATAASLNLFLQHYGTDTLLGTYLTTLIENLQLELGVIGCLFAYGNNVWNGLATDSWVKSLWERIDKFDLSLELNYNSLNLPRENDRPIMEWLVREGYRGAELEAINRVRKYQEAIFVSDIATASGSTIDRTYIRDWHNSLEGYLGKHRLYYEFGREEPTEQDWKDWKKALKSITISAYHGLMIPLGKWVA